MKKFKNLNQEDALLLTNDRQIIQSTSFEESGDLLQQISRKREEIVISFTGSVTDKNLPFFEDSLDLEIVKETGEDKSLKIYKSIFIQSDKSHILGSDTAKRLAVNMFKKLQDREYIQTDTGKQIYDSYIKLIEDSNFGKLKMTNEFKCNEEIINNCYSYLIIAIDPSIISVLDMSEAINEILKLSYVSQVPNFKEITTHIEEIKEENLEIVKKTNEIINKEIDANSKSMGWKTFQTGLKLIKSTLSGNLLLQALQMSLYSAVFAGGTKFFILPYGFKGIKYLNDNVFSDAPRGVNDLFSTSTSSSLTNKDNNPTDNDSEDPSSFKEIFKTFVKSMLEKL
jgi:hypothetical protein